MNEPAGGRRWVLDTNVMVSRAVRPAGTAARAVSAAVRGDAKLLVSAATLAELTEVLARPKFDPYITALDRRAFLAGLSSFLEFINVDRPIRACRDPKDDKFLEVAVHGRADALITGDVDLLALHPFHGVPILSPADFLLGLASAWPAQGEPGPTRSVQEASAPSKARRKATSP